MPSPEDVRAPTPESNGRASTEAVEEGVLANLPRTRPQRATERRIASRGGKRPPGRAGAAKTPGGAAKSPANGAQSPGRAAKGPAAGAAKAAGGATAKSAAPAGSKRATRATSPRKPRKATKPRPQAAPKSARPKPADSAPRQGFESEPTRTATGPVQPPGGAELVTSALEIFGEVARAGASAGERVLRDLFSRLPH